MTCPTCGHTMASLGYAAMDVKHFHCERCGTVTTVYPGGHIDTYVPKLVERCREFEKGLPASDLMPYATTTWRRLGIAESINLPEDRPV